MIELRRFVIDAKWLIIVFFYTESEENGKSLFGRKIQRRRNCCPFDRKLNPNEEIKSGAHGPGKGRGNAASAQEDKTITRDKRQSESLRILWSWGIVVSKLIGTLDNSAWPL